MASPPTPEDLGLVGRLLAEAADLGPVALAEALNAMPRATLLALDLHESLNAGSSYRARTWLRAQQISTILAALVTAGAKAPRTCELQAAPGQLRDRAAKGTCRSCATWEPAPARRQAVGGGAGQADPGAGECRACRAARRVAAILAGSA
jgi:hypothetical protein